MSLLAITDLAMEYRGASRRSRPLDGAALQLNAGEVVALVGESGSGKSTLANAIGRLSGRDLVRVSGSLEVDGIDVGRLSDGDLTELRRGRIGYIFQDPVAVLDPTMKIGRQVALALNGFDVSVETALDGLGLRDVERVLRSYPHEISGGMAQRIAIGIALARKPRLIIADEPTAALDASIKHQVLDLLVGACRGSGTALLIVTHDLVIVRQYASRVAVMYAGRIVEQGATVDVLEAPAHPYTAALLAAAIGHERPGERIDPIIGSPPQLSRRSEACAFAPRCRHADGRCETVRPEPQPLHDAICHYAGQFEARGGSA